jgi:hypothetical protein
LPSAFFGAGRLFFRASLMPLKRACQENCSSRMARHSRGAARWGETDLAPDIFRRRCRFV